MIDKSVFNLKTNLFRQSHTPTNIRHDDETLGHFAGLVLEITKKSVSTVSSLELLQRASIAGSETRHSYRTIVQVLDLTIKRSNPIESSVCPSPQPGKKSANLN